MKPAEERGSRCLKQDVFGRIELVLRDDGPVVRRVACGCSLPGTHLAARRLARREQRALERLRHLEGVPHPLGCDGPDRFYRSYIDGVPLYEARELAASYWSELLALVESAHAAGVAHNDLAKEANILVTPDRRPALVDFQIAATSAVRGRGARSSLFRLLCREDLRHVLKHKALHRPDLVTEAERRALAAKSLPVRLWSATLMKPYQRLIYRLGWERPDGPRGR